MENLENCLTELDMKRMEKCFQTLRECRASSKIGSALIAFYNIKQILNLGEGSSSKTHFSQAERRRLVHLIIDGCLESIRVQRKK